MHTEWRNFPCPDSSPSWRYLDNGRIETSDRGVTTRAWPTGVNQWKSLIDASAVSYGLPSHWVAAIMAMESGGKPGLCARMSDGTCAQNEGAGLMIMLPATASSLAGRSVTSEELLADHSLAIDLGAKYLRQNLDNKLTGGDYPGGDFVFAATSYNAGRVRCGTGSVWRPSGSNLPKVPCPATSWNVVMGCVDTKNGVVVSDYPRKVIELANAALDKGFGTGGAIPSPPSPPSLASTFDARTLWLAIGAIGSFYAYRWHSRRKRS